MNLVRDAHGPYPGVSSDIPTLSWGIPGEEALRVVVHDWMMEGPKFVVEPQSSSSAHPSPSEV